MIVLLNQEHKRSIIGRQQIMLSGLSNLLIKDLVYNIQSI